MLTNAHWSQVEAILKEPKVLGERLAREVAERFASTVGNNVHGLRGGSVRIKGYNGGGGV